MKNAVVYIRVSTREQDEHNQLNEIKKFCERENINIVDVYIDKGVSGSKKFKERENAKRLLEYLEDHKNEIDFLVVFSIDRVGRNMEDTVNTIQELEEQYNVKVLSVKEEFLRTLDENVRKLILSILSWVAEFERKRLRERQLAAWEAGKQKGRPPLVSDNEILKYLKKYRSQGLSYRIIYYIMKNDYEKKNKKFISEKYFYLKIHNLKKKGLIKEVIND